MPIFQLFGISLRSPEIGYEKARNHTLHDTIHWYNKKRYSCCLIPTKYEDIHATSRARFTARFFGGERTMATQQFTLTSYDPVYAIAEEVRIPEDTIRETAVRWLEINICKEGEKAKLTDGWVNAHCKDFKSVDELLIFIRYNMYRDNREVQELADQDAICKELSKRLVEELPADLVENSLYASTMRMEEMISRQGMTKEEFCEQRGITPEQLDADVRERTIQSLKEDSALAAYADHANYTLEAEDFYAIIPGDSIQDKAYKRRQIELDGRLPQMEEYARKTKALKEIMENAMIKRKATDTEWLRYGDTSKDVLNANKQFPENFVTL